MDRLGCLAAVVALALPLSARQEINPAASGKVDQAKVEAAIRKGAEYLKSNNADHLNQFEHIKRNMYNCELVLLTYVHAGVPETDPAFKELFDDMMKRKLEATYCVSLQAMILEELERVKHQWRLQQCAQFLVDNQSSQGFWGYGDPTIHVQDVPTTPPPRDVSTSARGGVRNYGEPAAPGARVKPKVRNKVTVKKMKDGSPNDNSNTQYAALGMRACHDAGVIIPRDVTELAIKWLKNCQKNEKNVRAEPLELDSLIGGAGPGSTAAALRIIAEPQGWCYKDHDDHKAYGSMTAGAIGSLAIWLYIKDNDEGRSKSWKRDRDVHEGLQWLNKNWSVTYNPGPYEHGDPKFEENSQHQYYYYLYALERTGMLYGTERIGSHEWYPEGAKVLLENQNGDGSWGGARNTCFAILFLKRATRPLVATHAAGGPR